MGDSKRRLDYLIKKSYDLGDIIAERFPDEEINSADEVFEVAGKLLLKLRDQIQELKEARDGS